MVHEELIAKFDHIYIHEDSRESSLAERVLGIFPSEKISFVRERPFAGVSGELSALEFARSKRHLYLAPFRGAFFKRCPGSRPGLACCNYFVLNWGQQCDMNCSYCYLQSFINSPVMTIYTNIGDALEELRTMGGSELTEMGAGLRGQALRVGTGETVDSLSLDDLTLFSHELIRFFRDYPAWTLEFKTKSAKVEQFLDVEHAGNVVVSWSVNPQNIISSEEHGTASLNARLDAARLCVDRGFKIAFHIDPMIWHPSWEESYSGLVDEIARRFTPSEMPYMSVGALRFQPEQRAMMRERFGMKSYVTSAEMFSSRDGKMRYDERVRQEMFKFVLDRFRSHSADWRIFMCMETPETWLKTAGTNPFKQERMNDLFDTRAVRSVASAKGATLEARQSASSSLSTVGENRP